MHQVFLNKYLYILCELTEAAAAAAAFFNCCRYCYFLNNV